MTPTREQLQSIARAVAAHASAVTKAGLPHDSEHGIGEYAAILAAYQRHDTGLWVLIAQNQGFA